MGALCTDVRQLHTVTPEARRIAGKWKNVENGYGTAVFGASVTT